MSFGTVSAQEEAPPPREPLSVLVTNSLGDWTPEQQARFKPPAALGDGVSTDWKQLTRTRPFKLLSYADRVELMTRPKRLLSSSWSGQYFSARYIMVMEPVDDDRVKGRLYDTQTGVERSVVVPSEKGEAGDSARGDVLAEARDLVNPQMAERRESWTDRFSLYDNLDRKLGLFVAQNIESRYRLAPEGPQTERVRRIGEQILRDNRFLDQGYQFIVLETPTINAFAAPTGPLYITTGMLEILDTDDELACILGHELSHSERHHARKQYERSREAGVVGLLVSVATGFPLAQLGTSILSTVLVRGYSRGYEMEADRDGMMMAYAAGYAPHDFMIVQEKLAALQERRGGRGPGWLRTHPRGEKRLKQLREILDRTEAARMQLDKLEGSDPGLARYLKSRVLDNMDQQESVDEYLDAYQKLLMRVDIPVPELPEPPSDPVLEDLDTLWSDSLNKSETSHSPRMR